jgi:hypothetical protein
MIMQHVHTLSKTDGIIAEPLIRVRSSAIMQLLRRLARSLRTIAEERAHRRAIQDLLRFDSHLSPISVSSGARSSISSAVDAEGSEEEASIARRQLRGDPRVAHRAVRVPS